MPVYVLMSRISANGLKQVLDDPDRLHDVRRKLEEYEANILADYHVLGYHNHCTIFEVSDNFRAQRAALNQELTHASDALLLPAIDLPLFQRMVGQEIRTEGPHEWQVAWWAKAVRASFRWYHFSRHIWKNCKPFTITGRENVRGIKGPCIVVGNQ